MIASLQHCMTIKKQKARLIGLQLDGLESFYSVFDLRTHSLKLLGDRVGAAVDPQDVDTFGLVLAIVRVAIADAASRLPIAAVAINVYLCITS
jgi:hypothetical protein